MVVVVACSEAGARPPRSLRRLESQSRRILENRQEIQRGGVQLSHGRPDSHSYDRFLLVSTPLFFNSRDSLAASAALAGTPLSNSDDRFYLGGVNWLLRD